MIRQAKHSLKFSNKEKQNKIAFLVNEYQTFIQEIVDRIWSFGYKNFSIQNNNLELGSFLDSEFLANFTSCFNERMKQCAGKQAAAMISSATEKRRKQLYKLKELQNSGESTKFLQRKIDIQPLIKPNASKINIELDSRFIDFSSDPEQKFTHFIRIHGLYKRCLGISDIKIPISYSKQDDKLNKNGILKKSIRLSKENINLYFESKVDKKLDGKIVGADQGITSVLTLSNNQQTKNLITPKNKEISLNSILEKLCRKKTNSKAYKRAQIERTNFINWSINQLDFSDVKELKLEKLFQIRKGKQTSKFLSRWTYTDINNKLARVAEEKGFLLSVTPNEFRSQRCSSCGWVRKSNRKGKTFKCNICGFTADADKNAASNLEIDLYKIPYWVRLKKINLKGFYWKPEGLFTKSQEYIVPDASRE
jgi:putative transposase